MEDSEQVILQLTKLHYKKLHKESYLFPHYCTVGAI